MAYTAISDLEPHFSSVLFQFHAVELDLDESGSWIVCLENSKVLPISAGYIAFPV